jgi:branched-chain amino acid transport system permease protein
MHLRYKSEVGDRLMLSSIVQGLLIGGIYGFVALSLTLIFGILKIINFSHGQIFMVGMFVAYFICTALGISPYIGLFLAAIVMFIIGYLIQDKLIKPVLRKEVGVREPIAALLLTAGLGIIFENLMLVIFGSNYRTLSQASVQTISIGDLILPLPQVYAFLIAFVCMFAFSLFLKKTEMGRVIRAVGQDRRTAYLMGINVERAFAICYGLGCASLGIAGSLMLPFYYLHPSVGNVFGNIAFITVVLGGLGSMPGAIIGGLILGVAQSVAAIYLPNTLSLAVVFYLFLVFVFIRPRGLFGSKHDW